MQIKEIIKFYDFSPLANFPGINVKKGEHQNNRNYTVNTVPLKLTEGGFSIILFIYRLIFDSVIVAVHLG